MIISKPNDSAKQPNGVEPASPENKHKRQKKKRKKQKVVLLPL